MVRREQDGGPAFEGAAAELFRITGGLPGDTPAIRAERERLAREPAEEKARREAARKAYLMELAETRWALYHLNFPENARGFGPWANEQISFSEKRGGSLLGFGFIDNPLNETEAERRAQEARGWNQFRRNVRDAFNAGQTVAQIKSGAGNWDEAPRDLQVHYGLGSTLVEQAAAAQAKLPKTVLEFLSGGLLR